MDTAKTALLILDEQPAILSMLKNEDLAKKILENTKKLIEAARTKGITIVFVRVAFTDEEFQKIPSRNKSYARFSEMGIKSPSQLGLHRDDDSAQIHPDLGVVQSNDIQIRKLRPGAFTNTNLRQELDERKIQNLIITGVSTSNAVLSVVRTAMDLDYGMIVVTDACADSDVELHNTMIKSFERSSDLFTTEELLQKLSSTS